MEILRSPASAEMTRNEQKGGSYSRHSSFLPVPSPTIRSLPPPPPPPFNACCAGYFGSWARDWCSRHAFFTIEKSFYFKVYNNDDDNNNSNTHYLRFPCRRCLTCHRKKSLRTGSFFAEFARISLGKILVCIYLWSLRELRTVAAQMLSLTKNTVGNIYALLRHYCGRDVQDRPFVPFGGRVYVTKCDESQFNHKSKVTFIR